MIRALFFQSGTETILPPDLATFRIYGTAPSKAKETVRVLLRKAIQ